jgi:hypothetical protein
MYDVIGSLIGIILIALLCSPILLAIYMWTHAESDIDNDGKKDLPNRWDR